MPHYALKRLEKKLKCNSKSCSIKIKSNSSSEKKLDNISFKYADQIEIDSLVSILKLENLDEKIIDQKDFLNRLVNNNLIRELERINNTDSEKLTSEYEIFVGYLLENNYAYLSTICDYIAGMTDNYAKKEFEDLY